MTALYHTQFHARPLVAWRFQPHHITAGMISNSTPGAPDSYGRAPYNLEIRISNLSSKPEIFDPSSMDIRLELL